MSGMVTLSRDRQHGSCAVILARSHPKTGHEASGMRASAAGRDSMKRRSAKR
jgi:hypothetical protein